jgi:hypothetical protein
MTPAEFIDQKGGPAAMTRAINEVSPPDKQITSGAVALWRHRNKLPRTAWPEIVEAFPGTTLDELKAVEAAGEQANAASGGDGEPQGAAA